METAAFDLQAVRVELRSQSVIAQGVVPILDGDTADDIAARVLKVEHQLLPQAVADFAAGRLKIDGNRVLNSRAADSEAQFLA